MAVKIPYQIKDTQGARVRFSFFYNNLVYSRTLYLSIADEDIETLTDGDLYHRLKVAIEKYLTLLSTATRITATTLLMCAEKTPWENVNCKNCVDCKNCVGCVNCSTLHSCVDCKNCVGCVNCKNCVDCKNCVGCVNCKDCSNCRNCFSCGLSEKSTNCYYCENCDNCDSCKHCSYVKTGYYLSSCNHCIECSNLVHQFNKVFERGDERFVRFDDDDDELPF